MQCDRPEIGKYEHYLTQSRRGTKVFFSGSSSSARATKCEQLGQCQEATGMRTQLHAECSEPMLSV
jgi:hypothetical protein